MLTIGAMERHPKYNAESLGQRFCFWFQRKPRESYSLLTTMSDMFAAEIMRRGCNPLPGQVWKVTRGGKVLATKFGL